MNPQYPNYFILENDTEESPKPPTVPPTGSFSQPFPHLQSLTDKQYPAHVHTPYIPQSLPPMPKQNPPHIPPHVQPPHIPPHVPPHIRPPYIQPPHVMKPYEQQVHMQHTALASQNTNYHYYPPQHSPSPATVPSQYHHQHHEQQQQHHQMSSTTSVHSAGQVLPPSYTPIPEQMSSSPQWPEGKFIIRSKMNTRLVFDAEGESKKNGTKLIVWKFHGRTNQQWIFEKGGVIRNVNSGLVLDIEGGKNGKRIICWPYHGNSNQKWRWDGEHIISMANGKFLDIKGASNEKGTNVIPWPKNNGPNQKWILQPIGDDFKPKSKSYGEDSDSDDEQDFIYDFTLVNSFIH